MNNKNLRVSAKFVVLAWIVGVATLLGLTPKMYGVSPKDCVQVRYITGVWMNSAGSKVAYLVRSPNLNANRNDYLLYVREMHDGTKFAGRLLRSGTDISQVEWLRDSRRIAFLQVVNGVQKLILMDAVTGKLLSTIQTTNDVLFYSFDRSADTLVYIQANRHPDAESKGSTSSLDAARGYRVDFGKKATDNEATRTVYVRRRNPDGNWSSPAPLTVQNPFTGERAERLVYARNLSLSPNGKTLFLTYLSNGVPKDWMGDPPVRELVKTNSLNEVMILYDMETKASRLAFKSLICYSKPAWSPDSRTFFLTAHSPVGSQWEQDDIRANRISVLDVNLFQAEVATGRVLEVFSHVPSWSFHRGPLLIREDGDLVLRTATDTVSRYHRIGDSWSALDSFSLPYHDEDRIDSLASNGEEILGTHETVSTPPDLFGYTKGEKELRLLTDINPELKSVHFAPVQTISWTTSNGATIKGLLFVPPDYRPGTRYPLVIQTKGDQGFFTCDSGVNHDPSFAPQPITTSGIMYLTRTFKEDLDWGTEVASRPHGYPGNVGEAVQQMDIWDSAVDSLSQRGMIDPSKVGIIGFSRTGWQVEFDLVHAKTHYAAATATDNVQYSLSEYWLLPSTDHDQEAMYGGPPFGQTLRNWEKYSISFNLERIHTPLLMEEMGYSHTGPAPGSLATALAIRYEITSGLGRLGKPFELYYYPDESHQPDHPQARLASLQRNVDWYRFWLQGYERPTPEDPDQYKRWEHLRDLHTVDNKDDGQANRAK